MNSTPKAAGLDPETTDGAAQRRPRGVEWLLAAAGRVAWGKVLWASLLVLHVWPLAQVLSRIVGGGGGWGALGALFATQALFALKLADVRWLRMPSRRGAVVAFLLATCLAHPTETFETLGHGALGDAAAAAVLASAPAAARKRPRRWLSRLLDGAARTLDHWRLVAARGVARRAFLAPVPILVDRRPPGRAPPRSGLR